MPMLKKKKENKENKIRQLGFLFKFFLLTFFFCGLFFFFFFGFSLFFEQLNDDKKKKSDIWITFWASFIFCFRRSFHFVLCILPASFVNHSDQPIIFNHILSYCVIIY